MEKKCPICKKIIIGNLNAAKAHIETRHNDFTKTTTVENFYETYAPIVLEETTERVEVKVKKVAKKKVTKKKTNKKKESVVSKVSKRLSKFKK